MIGAILAALPALLLIGVATPRQADRLFGPRPGPAGRRALRLAGLAGLVLSLAAALADRDPARAAIGWIGATGLMAFLLALSFTAFGRIRDR